MAELAAAARTLRDGRSHPPKPAAGPGAADKASSIEHITRHRRHGRCSPTCATASRTGSRPSTPTCQIDADRKVKLHRQRHGRQRRSAEIRASRRRRPRRRSSGRTSRPRSRSTRPACCTRRSSAKAEVRLNGSDRDDQRPVTGALGDGAFNGWASVDLASKPLVKLDLDFQKLDRRDGAQHRAARRAQPWSSATIDVNGLNYVDAAGARFRGRTHHRRRAIRARRDRRHARQRRAEGAGSPISAPMTATPMAI